MNKQHPITPPPELIRQWMERTKYDEHTWFYESYIAEQAARWGADQELEACVEWFRIQGYHPVVHQDLRADRRPKPPSLAEQALTLLDDASTRLDAAHENTIRRALERLQELEGNG